jgi:hypothetical protein
MHMLNALFKHFYARKHINLLITIVFIIPVLFIALSCGKRKPPLPPVEKISQRVEISGSQQGNKIIIFWRMPVRSVSENNVSNISRVDVYRLAESQNSNLSLSEDEFASNSTLIRSIPITSSDFGLKILSYSDEITFSEQAIRLRYAIRFVNAQGQKAAFSNFLVIQPTSKIAESPNLSGINVTEQFLKLEWNSPKANVDGSTPVNILGYNVYRISSESDTPKLLNSSPVTNTEYLDKLFVFEKEYSYFLRAVSLGSNGEPIESLDSNIVKVIPKDTFPPSAPTAITIAAAPNTLSIFFAVNAEKDVVGYKIYRSLDPNLPKNEWLLLTPETLKTNTFLDKTVEPGKIYYYYLTAVDTAGNPSLPSEVVTEIVP